MARQVVSKYETEADKGIVPNDDIVYPTAPRSGGGHGTHAAGSDLAEEARAWQPDQPRAPRQPAGKPDDYSGRLLKYIPAEVVALYVALDTVIRSSPKFPIAVYWSVFVFCVIATYLYLWRVQKVRKGLQLHISAIAFCVWVFALGGPFAHLSWYDPIYGGLLLPMYTFLAALIEA